MSTQRNGPPDTARLRLRRVTPDDAELMLAIWNDPAFLRYVGDRGIRTLVAAREAIVESVVTLFSRFGYGPYRVSLRGSDEPIGICGLFRRDAFEAPDIGFALLPAHCGRGYAWEAAQAVTAYARDELGIDRMLAIVSPENAASVGLIAKLGLRFETMHRMDGAEADSAIYAIDLMQTGAA